MYTIRIYIYFLLFPFLLNACGDDTPPLENETDTFELQIFAPVAVNKSNPMKIYVHYMPWFETKETNNGTWGIHWTMANKNPDNIDSSGKRDIAAHYYPLIGPYASSDPDVIEYHLLLMKYAGIDGLLIDWYGTRDLWDYPANKRNTETLVKALDKVGLDFAIVYEDQTLREGLDEYEKILQAKADMQYLESNFFNQDNYIKIDNKPLLLIFGPQEIKAPANWTSVFSILSTKPVFITLFNHISATNNSSDKNAEGEYLWVDAIPMETKYAQKDQWRMFIGGAYPGFNGYYNEGGWGNDPLLPIDYEKGLLFERLLQMAQDNNVDYLQLITWNDFGEGTMIEPTEEFRFSYLSSLQRFTGLSYNESVFEEMVVLYNLRKKYPDDKLIQEKLTQVFYYLVSLQTEEASVLINSLRNLN